MYYRPPEISRILTRIYVLEGFLYVYKEILVYLKGDLRHGHVFWYNVDKAYEADQWKKVNDLMIII